MLDVTTAARCTPHGARDRRCMFQRCCTHCSPSMCSPLSSAQPCLTGSLHALVHATGDVKHAIVSSCSARTLSLLTLAFALAPSMDVRLWREGKATRSPAGLAARCGSSPSALKPLHSGLSLELVGLA
eukprot:6198017-Pleurochrysis_carterae.AAC.1